MLQVYVVDSCSSEEELGESGEALVHCLSSPSLSGLPLLLVCSKQDLPTTRSITEVYIRHTEQYGYLYMYIYVADS